jgi:hypothetical protein
MMNIIMSQEASIECTGGLCCILVNCVRIFIAVTLTRVRMRGLAITHDHTHARPHARARRTHAHTHTVLSEQTVSNEQSQICSTPLLKCQKVRYHPGQLETANFILRTQTLQLTDFLSSVEGMEVLK